MSDLRCSVCHTPCADFTVPREPLPLAVRCSATIRRKHVEWIECMACNVRLDVEAAEDRKRGEETAKRKLAKAGAA